MARARVGDAVRQRRDQGTADRWSVAARNATSILQRKEMTLAESAGGFLIRDVTAVSQVFLASTDEGTLSKCIRLTLRCQV